MSTLVNQMNPSSAVLALYDVFNSSQMNYQCFNELGILKLWEGASRYGTLKKLFFDFLENPGDFCFPDGYDQLVFPPLELSECMCAEESGPYNRLVTTLRADFEKAILAHINERVFDKSEPLSLLSLGSGGLLQDFVLLGKLIQKGHTNLTLTLVDPMLSEDKVYAFQHFFERHFPKVNLSILSALSVKDLHPSKSFDLAYAIDFSDLFELYDQKNAYPDLNSLFLDYGISDEEYTKALQSVDLKKYRSAIDDVLEAKQLLNANASFFLGVGSLISLKLSKEGALEFIHPKYSLKDEPVFLAPPKKAHVIVDFTNPENIFVILANFMAKGSEKITLTIKTKQDFGFETSAPLFLKHYLPLFFKNVEVLLVDEYSEILQPVYATFFKQSIIDQNENHPFPDHPAEFLVDLDAAYGKLQSYSQD